MKKIIFILLLIPLCLFGQNGWDSNDFNVGGDLTVTGVFSVVNPHCYANFSDSTSTLAITSGTWVDITNTYDSLYVIQELSDITESNDTFIINTTGDYKIQIGNSFDAKDKKLYEYRVLKDATELYHVHCQGPKEDGIMNVELFWYGELEATDIIKVQVRCTDSSDDIDAIDGYIFIDFLHK